MNKLIKNLAVVAAISIAIIGVYTPATASANGGSWQRDSVGWWYKNSNGSYPKNDWQRIDGKWYYFDGRGYIIHSKWEYINGHWYYFNTSGHMAENTWKMIGDKWYYFDTKGHMLHDQWVGDYYVGKDGDMLKNTVTPDDYVVSNDGRWDRRFSQELVRRFGTIGFCTGAHSKESALDDMVNISKLASYDTALQLYETLCPNYNPVDSAKRIIKKNVEDHSTTERMYISRSALTERLTSFYKLPEEVVKKAFDELSREINFSEFFKKQAIKALKNTNSNVNSRASLNNFLTAILKFTQEETDNAFNTLNIDFAGNAQRQAERLLKDYMSGSSKLRIIKCLQNEYHFTKEIAEEGVNRLNYDFKNNTRRWIEEHFLSDSQNNQEGRLYSKKQMIDDAVKSDFTESEVVEVLAEYNINYTERAKLRALKTLKSGGYFRRDSLIHSLVNFWGFTEEEATNTVKDLKHENLID